MRDYYDEDEMTAKEIKKMRRLERREKEKDRQNSRRNARKGKRAFDYVD